MKTALEILNQVEPNGELLDTEQTIEAMEIYAKEYSRKNKLIHELFIGKVCDEIGQGTTIRLLKQSIDAINNDKNT